MKTTSIHFALLAPWFGLLFGYGVGLITDTAFFSKTGSGNSDWLQDLFVVSEYILCVGVFFLSASYQRLYTKNLRFSILAIVLCFASASGISMANGHQIFLFMDFRLPYALLIILGFQVMSLDNIYSILLTNNPQPINTLSAGVTPADNHLKEQPINP